MSRIPTSTRALVLGEKQSRTLANGKTIPYYNAAIEERALPKPGKEDVVVKITTAGFNHREACIKHFVHFTATNHLTPSTLIAVDSDGLVSRYQSWEYTRC